MIKNKLFRIISLVLVASILLPVFSSTCFADEANDSGIRQTNASIIRELLSDIDPDGSYTFNCEYDSEGRISKILCRSEGVETTYRYIYSGSSYEREVSVESIGELFSSQTTTELSGDDLKLTDASTKSKIEKAKALWNEANKNNDTLAKERANLEANIARADYCVLYPKSEFAYLFLEKGTADTNTAFRRELQLDDEGHDVLALQRALMYYGYMDVTDLPDENYGKYDCVTKDAVLSFQKSKFAAFMATGKADTTTVKTLLLDNSSNNKFDRFVNLIGFVSINLFRTRHNMVRDAVRVQVGALPYEPYVAGAGLKGNGGFVDVLKVEKPCSLAWEVKHDSPHNRKIGILQLNTYIRRSNDPINTNHPLRKTYCPMIEGTSIHPFTLPYSPSISLDVYSDSENPGVIYYTEKKNEKTETVPEVVPVPEEEKERKSEYIKISPPEPEAVLEGVVAAGMIVGTVYILKGIIAIAAAAPTGGTSLLLFAF